MSYIGTIYAKPEERKKLEDRGIKIGKWCTKDLRFENVRMDDTVLQQLEADRATGDIKWSWELKKAAR